MAEQQTPTKQQAEKPKTPRELAFDVLVKAYRESEQKGEKQAR